MGPFKLSWTLAFLVPAHWFIDDHLARGAPKTSPPPFLSCNPSRLTFKTLLRPLLQNPHPGRASGPSLTCLLSTYDDSAAF